MSKNCGRETVLFIIAHHADQKLGKKKLHLILIAGVAMFQLGEKLSHQRVNALGIQTDPEGHGEKSIHHGRGLSGPEGVPYLQIDTVFLHGVIQDWGLSVHYVRTCDIEGIRHYIIILPVGIQFSVSEGNVMYFITAAAVTVGRKGLCEPFEDNIQCPDADAVQSKADIQVGVECFQKAAFFLWKSNVDSCRFS